MAKMSLNFIPLAGENLSLDITKQIRRMLDLGSLRPGDKLPSTRELARELSVARGTVLTAMETLIAEGFLVTKAGSGTYVSSECTPTSIEPLQKLPPPKRVLSIKPDIDSKFSGALNFNACRPSMDAFPQNAWRKAASDAASRLPESDYGEPRGELALRVAIAAYLRRARGLDVNANEIIVTNGAMQAMGVVAKLYLTDQSAVAFENPGYPLARQCFAMTGAEVLPVSVDDDGLRVVDLPEKGGNIRLVYVTPSHQFPTGQRLSLKRRQQLLDWAMRNDVLILEDDYDGEYRYDIAPLPPMAAMNVSGHVMYFGTFSKTMFPSLRIGFAAGPEDLINEMATYRKVDDYQTNSLAQLALANFIETGQFEKHVQRMRRIYAKKRHRLRDVIAECKFPGVLTGTDSGLNALIRIDARTNATNIANRARLANICIAPVARYDFTGKLNDDALVFGYGAPTENQIEEGVLKLAEIIRRAN